MILNFIHLGLQGPKLNYNKIKCICLCMIFEKGTTVRITEDQRQSTH